MIKIIDVLVREGYNFHKEASKESGVKTYVMNWNSVRHWAAISDSLFKMWSIPEGTDGETSLMDTGILNNPSIGTVKDLIQKAKELM